MVRGSGGRPVSVAGLQLNGVREDQPAPAREVRSLDDPGFGRLEGGPAADAKSSHAFRHSLACDGILKMGEEMQRTSSECERAYCGPMLLPKTILSTLFTSRRIDRLETSRISTKAYRIRLTVAATTKWSIAMATSRTSPSTEFSRDVIGRYVCNGLEEAKSSANRKATSIQDLKAGGQFGLDKPQDEVWGLPWHSNHKFPGLVYCVGGRSLYWGSWWPELLAGEMPSSAWPAVVIGELTAKSLPNGSPCFIFGDLHRAMRAKLLGAIDGSTVIDAVSLSSLPDHPAQHPREPHRRPGRGPGRARPACAVDRACRHHRTSSQHRALHRGWPCDRARHAWSSAGALKERLVPPFPVRFPNKRP